MTTDTTDRVAVVFPGQGSQHPGMADPWLDHPASRAVLDRASNLLGWDVAERSREADQLEQTEIVQPALFACDLASFEVLRSEGLPVHAAAGHSLGEYAALVASGAVTFESALNALVTRAKAMGAAAREQPGAMTALLGLSPQEAAEVCEVAGRGDVLAVANENAPKQTVLSGSVAAIERAEEAARSWGAKAVRIKVAGAFHSPLMKPALQPVREAISRTDFRIPEFTVVPNVSAKPTTNPLALRDLLCRHVVTTVRWDASMAALAGLGTTWVVEAGPGDVLAKLARRAVRGAQARVAGNPDAAAAVAREVTRREAAPAEDLAGVGGKEET